MITPPPDHFSKIWSAPFTVPRREWGGDGKAQPYPLVPKYTTEAERVGPSNIALEMRLAIIEAMVFGARISSVCNPDGSVTTTLVWGG